MPFSLSSLKTLPSFCLRHYSNDHNLILKFSNIINQFSQKPLKSPQIAKRPLNKHPFEYNTLMKQFGKSGNYWEVVRLFKEMKFVNCKVDVVCYSTVIDSLVRFNCSKEAKAVFAEMIVLGLDFDVTCFTILVKLYSCCLKEFDLAYEVISLMVRNGISLDVVTYSTLITGLCWDLRVEEALGVLDWMIEEKSVPNVYTCTPIVHAYCRVGKVEDAKRFLDMMEKIDCLPNVVTYNILIEALCKVGDFDEVEKVISESWVKNWEPDEISYSIYMDGLCKRGMVYKAFDVVDVMIGKGLRPNELTLNILLDSLCQGSKIIEAKCLLEKNFELKWDVSIANYNTVMSRLCDAGMCFGVLKLFTDMLKKGIDANTRTFSILIDSLCKAGKFQMAKCIFDSKECVANVVTYTTLIHHFYAAGELDEVHHLFSKMDENNILPNAVTYKIMINCLCQEGNFLEAMKCFHQSLKDGFSPHLVATLIDGLIRGGKIKDALILVEQIRISGYIMDFCIFRSLIKAFCGMGSCRSGEIYIVCYILEQMLKKR